MEKIKGVRPFFHIFENFLRFSKFKGVFFTFANLSNFRPFGLCGRRITVDWKMFDHFRASPLIPAVRIADSSFKTN